MNHTRLPYGLTAWSRSAQPDVGRQITLTPADDKPTHLLKPLAPTWHIRRQAVTHARCTSTCQVLPSSARNLHLKPSAGTLRLEGTRSCHTLWDALC